MLYPCISYVGMCGIKGYGFGPFLSEIGIDFNDFGLKVRKQVCIYRMGMDSRNEVWKWV